MPPTRRRKVSLQKQMTGTVFAYAVLRFLWKFILATYKLITVIVLAIHRTIEGLWDGFRELPIITQHKIIKSITLVSLIVVALSFFPQVKEAAHIAYSFLGRTFSGLLSLPTQYQPVVSTTPQPISQPVIAPVSYPSPEPTVTPTPELKPTEIISYGNIKLTLLGFYTKKMVPNMNRSAEYLDNVFARQFPSATTNNIYWGVEYSGPEEVFPISVPLVVVWKRDAQQFARQQLNLTFDRRDWDKIHS